MTKFETWLRNEIALQTTRKKDTDSWLASARTNYKNRKVFFGQDADPHELISAIAERQAQRSRLATLEEVLKNFIADKPDEAE